jgi:hypothetical protein
VGPGQPPLPTRLVAITVRRIHGDKGYRGHNYPNRFKAWISGQVRRVTTAIRREMRRRAAVEPVIGHLKEDHRMRRNYLTGRDGDRINAVLAAAGYNFSLLLRWFAELLRALPLILCHAFLAAPLHLRWCRKIASRPTTDGRGLFYFFYSGAVGRIFERRDGPAQAPPPPSAREGPRRPERGRPCLARQAPRLEAVGPARTAHFRNGQILTSMAVLGPVLIVMIALLIAFYIAAL